MSPAPTPARPLETAAGELAERLARAHAAWAALVTLSRGYPLWRDSADATQRQWLRGVKRHLRRHGHAAAYAALIEAAMRYDFHRGRLPAGAAAVLFDEHAVVLAMADGTTIELAAGAGAAPVSLSPPLPRRRPAA